MKIIISFFIIILVQTLNLKAEDFKLNQIISGLNSPWSLTFKNQNEILMTEKSGQILFINLRHLLHFQTFHTFAFTNLTYHVVINNFEFASCKF